MTLAILLAATSCGGGSGGSKANKPPVNNLPPNSPPTSEAGEDQSVKSGEIVSLSGSGSDPDGAVFNYIWTQVSGPGVLLENPMAAETRFVAPFIENFETLEFELAVTDTGGLTARDGVSVTVDSDFVRCVPTPPPMSLNLDPFYEKYCDANGIPIVSSGIVADQALEWVAYQALLMSSMRIDVLEEMKSHNTRMIVMATTEVVTDLPEYADHYDIFPDRDWDSSRGLGPVPPRGVGVTSEENALCMIPDPLHGESVFVHEFAHAIGHMGLILMNDPWFQDLTDAYNAARAAGRFINTYAGTNKWEYWAEGVQSFYDVNNGLYDTRDDLATYDATLYQIIVNVMPQIDITLCPTFPLN